MSTTPRFAPPTTPTEAATLREAAAAVAELIAEAQAMRRAILAALNRSNPK